MKKLTEVLAAVGAPQAEELFAPHWEESQCSQPAGTLELLRPGFVRRCREFAGFPAEVEGSLLETAAAIAADEALSALVWHCRRLLYEHRDYPAGNVRLWPSLEQALGGDHHLFYVLAALGAVELTIAYHQPRGISEAITRRTVSQHAALAELRWDETHRRWTGTSMSLYWSRWHAWGELYGLGRFEYMVRPFTGRLRAYRRRSSREVLALAEDGARFTDEGYMDADPDTPAMRAGFSSRLVLGEKTVSGQVISPLGRATRETVSLSLAEWEPALAPGDPLLDTHIPAGGGMTPELVQESMRQALEFFPKHFPERTFVGFGCVSWILNPDLEEMLGGDSNMLLWQRELYLFPWPSEPRDGLAAAFD
jgi:hypothetical protein